MNTSNNTLKMIERTIQSYPLNALKGYIITRTYVENAANAISIAKNCGNVLVDGMSTKIKYESIVTSTTHSV